MDRSEEGARLEIVRGRSDGQEEEGNSQTREDEAILGLGRLDS